MPFIQPQADTPPPAAVAPAPLNPAALNWRHLPSARDFARVFPERAMRRDLEGRVVLDCVVADTGRLGGCQVTSEDPPNENFGAAAMQLSVLFEVRLEADPSVVGKHVRLPIRFNLPRG